jgi:hypothetical protein
MSQEQIAMANRVARALLLALASLCLGRGGAHADAPQGRYVLRAQGTLVYDVVTHLEWTTGGLAHTDYASAANTCSIHGSGGFRLPTRQELLTLLDLGEANDTSLPLSSSSDGRHAMSRAVFGQPDLTGYWSSTRSRQAGGYWVVSSTSGAVFNLDPAAAAGVRCVRRVTP